jgi:type III restriction enzyme
VQSYVLNDRLELTVPCEFYGQPGAYEPDFVVRLADGSQLLLEVKGPVPAEVSAKHEAAARWVAAVNRWGQLGHWCFLPCHEPQRLLEVLRSIAAPQP